jgi:hypothetical protein
MDYSMDDLSRILELEELIRSLADRIYKAHEVIAKFAERRTINACVECHYPLKHGKICHVCQESMTRIDW